MTEEKKKLQKKREKLPRLTFILSLIFPGLGHYKEGRIKAGFLLSSFTVLQIFILVVGLVNERMVWFGGALDGMIATWASVLFILGFWAVSYITIRRSFLKEESGGYWTRAAREFMRHRKGLIGAFIVLLVIWAAVFAPLVAPYKPLKMDLMHTVTGPGGGGHPLGTDNFGRDILTRIIYGSRVALGVGGGATLLNMVFGGILGLVGGFYKGIIDSVIMRFLEVLNSIPYIIFALLVLSVFGAGVMQIIIVLGIYGLQAARIIRSEVLSVREEDYIMACDATGAGDFRKIFNHIFPNSMASLLVVTTMRIGINIIVVAGLSFLGFGVKPPTASWGAMLQASQAYMTVAWWMAVFPGLTIVFTVFGFNLLG
ncbi:MAG: ABC transporter permease, partial [Candidatus Bipolaricaulia bacterium]